jgi:hypothetical protein
MVPQREQQHKVLLDAVQNLNPDVVICDEIGTPQVCSCRAPGSCGESATAGNLAMQGPRQLAASGIALMHCCKPVAPSQLVGGKQGFGSDSSIARSTCRSHTAS